jgi:hypothetical protein
VRQWFAGRGLIDHHDVVEMPARENSGCSLDAAVRVAAHDRADISGLLSYWLGPPMSGLNNISTRDAP